MAALLIELQRHCARAVLEPFAFGRLDCSLWAADWILLRTGVDVAAAWRGTYATRLGYLRKLHKAGGLKKVATDALEGVGGRSIEPGTAPLGSIGLIATRDGAALAVRVQLSWAAKTGDGLVFCPVAIAAWGF